MDRIFLEFFATYDGIQVDMVFFLHVDMDEMKMDEIHHKKPFSMKFSKLTFFWKGLTFTLGLLHILLNAIVVFVCGLDV